MKELVQNTIEFYGMGHPDIKTIFHMKDATLPTDPTEQQRLEYNNNHAYNQSLLNNPKFKSLTTIAGRRLSAFFKYKENGVEKEGRVQMQVIKSDDEQAIKTFILDTINQHLSNG